MWISLLLLYIVSTLGKSNRGPIDKWTHGSLSRKIFFSRYIGDWPQDPTFRPFVFDVTPGNKNPSLMWDLNSIRHRFPQAIVQQYRYLKNETDRYEQELIETDFLSLTTKMRKWKTNQIPRLTSWQVSAVPSIDLHHYNGAPSTEQIVMQKRNKKNIKGTAIRIHSAQFYPR